MFHVCKTKKGIPCIKIQGKPFESTSTVCTCGKVIHTPTKDSNTMKKAYLLIILLSCTLLVLVFLIYSKKTASSKIHTPPSTASNEEQPDAPYDNDPTLQKRNAYGTYFLDIRAFKDAVSPQKKKAKSVDDYRDALMTYLSEQSPLVKEKFNSDTSLLWKHIQKNKPTLVVNIEEQIGKNKGIENINLSAIPIYNDQDEIQASTLEVAKEPEDIEAPQETIQAITDLRLATEYLAGGNLWLKITSQKVENNQLNFIYSIRDLDGRGGEGLEGILFTDGRVIMDALKWGEGSFSRNQNGSTQIKFPNKDKIFESTN